MKTKRTFKLASELYVGDEANTKHALWEDDITMRVTTDAVELKPGGPPVSHQYLLYNGPVKPSLLGQLPADLAVSPEVVERYANTLQLNKMTDYHSPGMMGSFASSIGWTWLLITFTNVMHKILSWLHMGVASYGLCIIFLTVMVRGLMFPLSRKQALMTMKMQALAPEQKKLQLKYKDDKQALGLAQMELYRKNGVNPFGSCWVMLLQMPIFMGLYYALQESILFRLKSFWPTWVENLAAPDMMIWWSESIPWISRPQDYGSSIVYLGPYLNLLPIIAVSFMIVQQKLMMPPPTDEQQEMQQKMMKYMMVVFGLMFYKVAAGLCIYFIATTLWGFTERKLLPKAKPPGAPANEDDKNDSAPVTSTSSDKIRVAQKTAGAFTNGSSWGKKQGRNKRKSEKITTAPGKEAELSSGVGRMIKRMGDWWNDLLEQAKKK
jgi:YidC/Oxa1 family membrane protein insertase